MKLLCPACREPIVAENVNVAADLAKCPRCNEVQRASALVAAAEPVMATPPAGSTVRFVPEGVSGGVITVPRQGFSHYDAFMAMFATLWMVIIASWTWGARGDMWYAAYSIIFWVVGFAMWRGILIRVTESQEIRVERERLQISKRSIISRRQIEIPHAEIDAIEVQPLASHDPMFMARHFQGLNAYPGQKLATVVHGARKTCLAENVSEAEAEWLVGLLKSLLFTRTGRTV